MTLAMNVRLPPPSDHTRIDVKGARVHNLRSVDLSFPKRRLVVFTGVSGSGKSSLAFDTLFAEGQRRYVEGLSVYARQFLGKMARPDVDRIIGLSPTVSIEQKTASYNPRSTVGTITEIYDHLRVLYAQLGVQHCHSCGDKVGAASPTKIAEVASRLPDGTRFQVLAPLIRNRKGEFRDLFDRLRREGFVRARIDGEVIHLDQVEKLRKSFKHDIDVVVDRMVAKSGLDERLRAAIDTALRLSDGRLIIAIDGDAEAREQLFSAKRHCARCDISFPELTHQSFSFNSPLGACDACGGLGTHLAMDPDRVVPDPAKSINDGCFEPLRRQLSRAERWYWRVLEAVCAAHDIDTLAPWRDLPQHARETLLRGVDGPITLTVKGRVRATTLEFNGVLAHLEALLRAAETESARERLSAYLAAGPCPSCGGKRLRPESAAVRVSGRSLPDVCAAPISEADRHFAALTLTGDEARIGDELLREIRSRLRFLQDVGLEYLSLDRPGPSLSGGEAQRIRLARQIGSDLTGVLYVLDEPSIGLHARDNERLLRTIERLRDAGNSVIVVEHDLDTILAADWVVDFGPGAGAHGGEVAYSGPPSGLADQRDSLTGDYLSGRRTIPVPDTRRPGTGNALRVLGAQANNLKALDVSFPLGTLTCVTGVSGAGKSTLVNEILYPAVANHLYKEIREVARHVGIDGLEHIDKVVRIDQQPIGRTPRSNPATYTKVFDEIRSVFAGLPEARIYGYTPGRFSFNVEGGRCEACSGSGVQRIEMHFMADVFVTCDSCRGRRFNDATLRVRYRGRDIASVLDMTFEDAAELFVAYPKIRRSLDTVNAVGLGYLRLGQPSPTLSGGEAQRAKLSRELSKAATGRTLYILDEPSTGLHFEDIKRLLEVLHRLVDAGNTVVVIEHNLDIIKTADHVIDLGPEGGSDGGAIVAAGTPEVVAAALASHTGAALREVLSTVCHGPKD